MQAFTFGGWTLLVVARSVENPVEVYVGCNEKHPKPTSLCVNTDPQATHLCRLGCMFQPFRIHVSTFQPSKISLAARDLKILFFGDEVSLSHRIPMGSDSETASTNKRILISWAFFETRYLYMNEVSYIQDLPAYRLRLSGGLIHVCFTVPMPPLSCSLLIPT